MSPSFVVIRSLASVALACAVAAVLAACASGTPGSAPATDSETGSPLDPYFEVLYGGAEDLDAQNRATQDLVTRCMKEQGFSYVPDDVAGISVTISDDEPEWGSREFAEQYGYGAITSPALPDAEEFVDPNADYLAGLSESERAAWELALYGAPIDPGVASFDYDWSTAGCFGRAIHQTDEDSGSAAGDPEFAGLVEQMQGLSTKAAESDAVLAAEREWSDCLASAGHPGFEHKGDPLSRISADYAEITRPTDAPDQSDGSTAGGSDPDPALLKDLTEREIALAVADFDCAESSGYAETLAAEERRLDQEFVDANRTRLDAMVAAHGHD
jgi:hypothetical protein